MIVGSLVGVVFGLVLVEVSGGGLPGGWPLVVRVIGAVVAVVLLAGVLRMAREGEVEGELPSGGFAGRRYWYIVGLAGLALVAGLVVINGVHGWPDYGVPWIELVVGVHFVLLARRGASAVVLYVTVAIAVLRSRPVSVRS